MKSSSQSFSFTSEHWVAFLAPILGILLSLLLTGVIITATGANPFSAAYILVASSLGSLDGLVFTLYYTTNFIFAGLAVAVALHGGLFNIGVEGQATVAGLFMGCAALFGESWPFIALVPFTLVAGLIGGMLWGFIPGWLQAKRGSHVVITTILLNLIAASFAGYLLSHIIGKPGSLQLQSNPMPFTLPMLDSWLPLPPSPLNAAFLVALAAIGIVWIFIYRTLRGYNLRVVGANPEAAHYAGLSVSWTTIGAMVVSGLLASGIALNEVLGVQHRVILDFSGGAGFIGIAVALIGRGHPLGIFFSALLFGVLYRGGAELAFEWPMITRDIVIIIAGIVIFVVGALDRLMRQWTHTFLTVWNTFMNTLFNFSKG
jgi:simple sugar transport system permease protein